MIVFYGDNESLLNELLNPFLPLLFKSSMSFHSDTLSADGMVDGVDGDEF